MVTPDQWRAAGATFEWRGQQIFYRIEGKGDPLLLIHGFPTASWDYYAIWPKLVEKFRVLTLDMIGFGFSAKPQDFQYSILAQADLYEQLLVRENVTRYRLVSHDYGDSVAQELLARDLEAQNPRIVAAALLNGGIFPEAHRPLLVQRLLRSPLGKLVSKITSYKLFARNIHGIWGDKHVSDEEVQAMWQLVTASDGLSVMPKLIGYLGERKQYRDRWVKALTDARCPLRLIDGLVDPIAGAHTVARYRELVKNPDVVELPGVGHYPQVEVPEAVVAALLPWLETSGTSHA